MTHVRLPAFDSVLTCQEAVDPAELESLAAEVARATSAPIAFLDSAHRPVAVAGGEGRLAELLWRVGDGAKLGHLSDRIRADDGGPMTMAMAGSAVLLAAFVSEPGGSAAVVAGPMLTVPPEEIIASDARLGELAALIGSGPEAVRAACRSEPPFDEHDLAHCRAHLAVAARALSLLGRPVRALARRQAELGALNDMSALLSSTLDIDRVLQRVLDKAIELGGARCGSLMLLDPARECLTIAKARGLSAEIIAETRVPMGEGIAGWVAQQNAPRVMLRGVRDLLSRCPRPKEQLTSALSAPIRAGGRVIGVINISDCIHAENFDEGDLRVLQLLSVPAGIALENARVRVAVPASV